METRQLAPVCHVCGEEPVSDAISGIGESCWAELAMDRAEMDREDCRVNLCSPGCAWCGGCGVL